MPLNKTSGAAPVNILAEQNHNDGAIATKARESKSTASLAKSNTGEATKTYNKLTIRLTTPLRAGTHQY